MKCLEPADIKWSMTNRHSAQERPIILKVSMKQVSRRVVNYKSAGQIRDGIQQWDIPLSSLRKLLDQRTGKLELECDQKLIMAGKSTMKAPTTFDLIGSLLRNV